MQRLKNGLSELGPIHDYAAFVDALVARRHALGWSQAELDQRAGWPDGYAGKLESWQGPQGRIAGSVSMPLWLQTLGITLVPLEVPGGPPPAHDGARLTNPDMVRRLPADA